MDKILLILFLSLAVTPTWSACGRPVDPKKVVLFLDDNLGEREALTAEAAACARGETFVRVPENFNEYAAFLDVRGEAYSHLETCLRKLDPKSVKIPFLEDPLKCP